MWTDQSCSSCTSLASSCERQTSYIYTIICAYWNVWHDCILMMHSPRLMTAYIVTCKSRERRIHPPISLNHHYYGSEGIKQWRFSAYTGTIIMAMRRDNRVCFALNCGSGIFPHVYKSLMTLYCSVISFHLPNDGACTSCVWVIFSLMLWEIMDYLVP